MLHLKEISYSIGERQLLHDLDLTLSDGKRVALIGANGVGKTTLLRIINGDISDHEGTILKPNQYTIGYLPQEEIAIDAASIIEFVLQGRKDLLDMQKRMQALRTEMAESPDAARQLGDALGSLEHQFEHLGGYKLDSDARAILAGLGFDNADLDRDIYEFSGGWRMRVYLARLLLQHPDLLLLDEPTNHLDLSSLEWLEMYLQSFSGSMIIVSHDRFFIDRLAQEICELRGGCLHFYAGNYHFFEQQKAKERQLLLKKAEQTHKEREKQQAFIDRFRSKNTKASQVQSRIKMLEKLPDIETESEQGDLDFKLSVSVPSYKDVLHIKNMSFRYAKNWILSNVNLELYRGQKIALVGDNGAGKTTLTRLIVGQLEPQQGSIQVGTRVSVGYYAQHQIDALNVNATAFDEISSSVDAAQIPQIRNILGLFGLRGDDIFKKISVLSGGEKARVSLAKILLSPVNFLIMDEPTNHLDLRSREALERALAMYDGTLILISHDRYFLDKLVHKVIEIQDAALCAFEGNYSDYLVKKTKREQERLPTTVSKADGAKKSKEEKRKAAHARQAISKQRNDLLQSIQQSEHLIENLEKRKSDLERLLAEPDSYKSQESAASLTKEYHQIKKDIERHLENWEQAHEELEQLLAQIETT